MDTMNKGYEQRLSSNKRLEATIKANSLEEKTNKIRKYREHFLRLEKRDSFSESINLCYEQEEPYTHLFGKLRSIGVLAR